MKTLEHSPHTGEPLIPCPNCSSPQLPIGMCERCQRALPDFYPDLGAEIQELEATRNAAIELLGVIVDQLDTDAFAEEIAQGRALISLDKAEAKRG